MRKVINITDVKPGEYVYIQMNSVIATISGFCCFVGQRYREDGVVNCIYLQFRAGQTIVIDEDDILEAHIFEIPEGADD